MLGLKAILDTGDFIVIEASCKTGAPLIVVKGPREYEFVMSVLENTVIVKLLLSCREYGIAQTVLDFEELTFKGTLLPYV